jgi:hypothetical protein
MSAHRRVFDASRFLGPSRKINDLSRRRQGAKIRNSEPLCSLGELSNFAPWRESFLLFLPFSQGFGVSDVRARFWIRRESWLTFSTIS